MSHLTSVFRRFWAECTLVYLRVGCSVLPQKQKQFIRSHYSGIRCRRLGWISNNQGCSLSDLPASRPTRRRPNLQKLGERSKVASSPPHLSLSTMLQMDGLFFKSLPLWATLLLLSGVLSALAFVKKRRDEATKLPLPPGPKGHWLFGVDLSQP